MQVDRAAAHLSPPHLVTARTSQRSAYLQGGADILRPAMRLSEDDWVLLNLPCRLFTHLSSCPPNPITSPPLLPCS